jgi:uncharacterized membrane protein
MNPLAKNRIETIDLLKGIVMVIMALDHIRDFIHIGAYSYSPTNPNHSTVFIYFTRWITHFCAPVFCFLAGTSVYFSGKRKTKGELSSFLIKRGLWLALMEITIINFAWFFNIHFNTIVLMVIWELGISMIFLAALIYLPNTIILIFSCLLIFGHNLLDGVHFKGNLLWAILHDISVFNISDSMTLGVYYHLIPWVAVMSLGYYFGTFYDKSFDGIKRKKILNIIGISAIVLFIALSYLNIYGDPRGWKHYDTATKTLMSVFNPNKYPPSLLFLLMTLGPAFIFLANSENLKGKIVNFFSTFGRVPFFYYVIHLYIIHVIACLFAQLSGYGWQSMIITNFPPGSPALKGFGFRLWVVYLVWIAVIAITYPLCKWFDNYKMSHKEKRWLSYL